MAAAGCPLGEGVSPGSLSIAADRLQAMIVRANSAPLANHLGTGQVADGALLLNGVAAALYSKAAWPDLKTGLSRAFGGDGTVLVQLANLLLERNPDGTYSNLVDADTAISCVDRPWPRSLTAWQAQAAAAGRAAPLFGPPFVWGNLPCAYWPVPPAPPPAFAACACQAADLSSDVLLGWNGDGHTAYGEGSACVDQIVNAYLISLTVPRTGTLCP